MSSPVPFRTVAMAPSTAATTRGTHFWIDIDNGVEIRLSDKPSGTRPLHLRDLPVAHDLRARDRVAANV